MERPTLAVVADIVRSLVDRGTIHCPKTANKGAVGILCEVLTGIPQSCAHLDCSDGEVKVFPLKQMHDGSLMPKETIAVTMLNPKSLTEQTEFATSTCGRKLHRVLFVPYLRENTTCVRFFLPTDLTLTPDICTQLQRDYDAIRNDHVSGSGLKSKTGVFLQNRTKGAGGNAPKTRAFYLRQSFIHAFVTKTW